MTTNSESGNDDAAELLDRIAEGIAYSAYTAVLRARFYHVPLICWQDGKIVEIDPETVPVPPDVRVIL